MGKNELSEAGTSMVRDNMANFRRDTRKTRVTGYPGDKAWLQEKFHFGCHISKVVRLYSK